jgi:hypothetical protein
MENTDVPNAWWQDQMTRDSERWLLEVVVLAEPLLYIVAALAFLAGSALLLWKTRVPGRLLILSSMLVLATTLPLGWRASANILTPSSAWFALAKLAVALAAMLCALGYGRIVLHLYRSARVAKES